ncbi:MAG: S10 family peptidase [Terracidiphilus sp.]
MPFRKPIYAASSRDMQPKPAPAAAAQPPENYPPPDSTTEGSISVDGQRIDYTAVAGIITVGATNPQDAQLGVDGKPMPGTNLAAAQPKDAAEAPPVAHMFYIYYRKTGADAVDRPVTLIYNGGPGSATVWLHMGAFGPEHIVTSVEAQLPPAPYKMEQNPNCLLDASDLVFIDAPGTGFSQIAGKDAGKAFYGVNQDAGAFARFISRFLSRYGRWNSPKYLLGESYGTTRSAVLARDLEKNWNIDLNGIILLSQIFNFTAIIDAPANNHGIDLPYELALPTYAATAWFHNKIPRRGQLTALLNQVEDYAMGPYRDALTKGTDLTSAEEQQVADKLQEYTGVPAEYWIKADLRVSGPEFEKTLLAGQEETTGRLDTRFSGPTIDPLSQNAQYDPQSAAISAAYTALFNQYARQVLKYGGGMTYQPLLLSINSAWQWQTQKGSATGTNVSSDLATAMKTDPRLEIMVNGGYFDLATPFAAAEYEDKHLPIPASLAKNIEYDWYPSGHMIYVNESAGKLLHDRIAAFIERTDHESK